MSFFPSSFLSTSLSLSLSVSVGECMPLGECSLHAVSNLHQRDGAARMQMAGRRETKAELQRRRQSSVLQCRLIDSYSRLLADRLSRTGRGSNCLRRESRCERDATQAPCCLHINNSANSFSYCHPGCCVTNATNKPKY